jgi:hypothetical protein
LGLALGAVTGEAKYAAAGMAAGAAAGAAGGAMYEYDQSREDRRTQMLAEAIGGARQGETADEAGRRHLEDFLGDWRLDIWVIGAGGKRITARGRAKGVLLSKTAARIDYTDITTADYDEEVTGHSILSYAPSSGFSLENRFSTISEVRKYVGEYLPAKNSYNYYPVSDMEGKTMSGIIRSDIRIELRTSGSNLFVAETYALVDGEEVQIQSYRFVKE